MKLKKYHFSSVCGYAIANGLNVMPMKRSSANLEAGIWGGDKLLFWPYDCLLCFKWGLWKWWPWCGGWATPEPSTETSPAPTIAASMIYRLKLALYLTVRNSWIQNDELWMFQGIFVQKLRINQHQKHQTKQIRTCDYDYIFRDAHDFLNFPDRYTQQLLYNNIVGK